MLCNSCSQFDSLPWKNIRMHCLQSSLQEEEELATLDLTAIGDSEDEIDALEAASLAREERREVHKLLPSGRSRKYLEEPCVKLYHWWHEPVDRPWDCICCGKDIAPCSWFVRAVFRIATHWSFTGFITLCILVNTLTLGLDMYPSPPVLTDTLEVILN